MIDVDISEPVVIIWKPPTSAYPFVEGGSAGMPFAINFRGGLWDGDFIGACSTYAEALDGARMVAGALGLVPLDLTGEAHTPPG